MELKTFPFVAGGVSISPSAILSSIPGMLNTSSSSKNNFSELPCTFSDEFSKLGSGGDGNDDDDDNEGEGDGVLAISPNASAASIAAYCISLMEDDLARGNALADSGKFKEAESPLRAKAAAS
ncbi:hypothetical protein QQP08_016883 [Theobroma cacao]|nr:hypothetical protein QQP08_016883 [Theobroma cacao]